MLNGAAELVSVAALLAVLAWAVIRPRGWPEAVAAVLVLAQMCDGEGDLLIVARDGDRSRPGPKSLGPATRFVVDHAPCPVVLVWPGEPPRPLPSVGQPH